MPGATIKQPRSSPSQLLLYLERYRVLICKDCRYAIQPSAISRHLKDLHHIYRSDRQELLQYTKSLQLADPGEVVLPPPHEPPISLLPTEQGLACAADGCTHLCVTVKRMKSHWATTHRDVVGDVLHWRPVTLQTFFRGNQLRYFVVCPDLNASSEVGTSPETDTSTPPNLVSEPSMPSSWSADEVALFTHFKTYTSHTMGGSVESRKVWATGIPELAYKHEFLKHEILACSALHLAHLNPSQRRCYQMKAATHQEIALPLFRDATYHLTTDNCNAILVFVQLLIVHCFASEATDEDFLLVNWKEESGIPDWLQIIRSSCTMFVAVWGYMRKGLIAPLIEEAAIELDDALPIIPEEPELAARLRDLLSLPLYGRNPLVPRVSSLSTKQKQPINLQLLDENYLADSGAEMALTHSFALDQNQFPKEKLLAFSSAMLALSRAFVVAKAAREKGLFTLWKAVHSWPTKVSLEFLELLRAREPVALVLLAHYCVLLEPLEETWYMSGLRKRLLRRIWGQLDEEWRKWLDWPFQRAGFGPFDEPETDVVMCDTVCNCP